MNGWLWFVAGFASFAVLDAALVAWLWWRRRPPRFETPSEFVQRMRDAGL